jgi:hypothetical protein
MMTKTPDYRRLNAMTFAAPAGFRIFAQTSPVREDLARLRIYSEERAKVGDRLRLEVFPDGVEERSVVLFADVAWVIEFEPAQPSPAPYELGLDVTWLAAEDEDALASVV